LCSGAEGSEGSWLGQRGVVAEEREASSLVDSAGLAQEQSPEQARENPYRQKEPRATRHPARVIKGAANSAARRRLIEAAWSYRFPRGSAASCCCGRRASPGNP
jgi:hypothetical protein